MKKIAIILSGSGVYDGSEIHESVLTLLAIEQKGASYRCFAPNIEQHHVINHLNGEVMTSESRNVLEESARIARGDIEDVEQLNADEFDALIVPGGFGAAKNLCDFAIHGENCQINEQVLTACQQFKQANKPAGYMCIAPTLISFVYGKGASATIGKDQGVAAQLEAMGLNHINCEVNDVVIDKQRKLVTTPAYMLAMSLVEASSGINKLVDAIIAMCD
ncbi:isoprenoid biosynthesis glyoxalase ElbB [Thalassotalea sp. G2M2-11]|uniref:isoprenoid biosynthesis glyoxalase ElbB n=1 Tax=Thalassotalea sp. G2M2-11 TaxID=2787627 RepID=UPI0019D02357|nr:isoprenoid biosynthesis glyoxalase ElbB [Thalassotalea sp. G2M2-11]